MFTEYRGKKIKRKKRKRMKKKKKNLKLKSDVLDALVSLNLTKRNLKKKKRR